MDGHPEYSGRIRPEELQRHRTPYDLKAESAVIGACLVSEDAIGKVSEILRPEDFYNDINRQIYRVVLTLYGDGEPVDRLSVGARVSLPQAEEHIFNLVESVPVLSYAPTHARRIRSLARKRAVIDASDRMLDVATDPDTSAQDAIEAAERALYSAIDDGGEKPLEKIGSVGSNVLARVQELHERGGDPVTGIPSGFADHDQLTTGYQRGDLIVLAARPSMGKTAFATQVATNSADEGYAAAIYSMEMSREQLYQRIWSQRSGVPITSIRTGNVAEKDWPRLVSVVGEIDKLDLFVDDSPFTGVAAMRSHLRKLNAGLKREGKQLGLVVVDYLQLMGADGGSRRDSRNLEIGELTRSLKILARDLDITVLLLSQLSRAVEQRGDRRPRLSDLRDSGSIEQDADLAMFLYRDEYYNGEHSDARGLAEVIIGKHRNGPTGTTELVWLEKTAAFANLQRYSGMPLPDGS